MIKHSTVFQPWIIRIVEIVFLSLFIISFFFEYAYGVEPISYVWAFWDIWGNSPFDGDWNWIVIIGFPLILSFVLLILISVKPKFGKQTLKWVSWFILGIYTFIMVLFLVRSYIDSDIFGPPVISIIFSLVFSLFLIVLTMLKSKDNYLKIENYILSIITIPILCYSVLLLDCEFGGYLLNICFAVLYVIAVRKVFLLKKNEDNSTA